jgi:hypothetical protein
MKRSYPAQAAPGAVPAAESRMPEGTTPAEAWFPRDYNGNRGAANGSKKRSERTL